MKKDGNLRLIFSKRLPMFHWQSIETAGIASGVPDSNFCYRSKEGWIEFKTTSKWKPNIHPAQIAWISQRLRAGGHVFIAIRRKHEGGPRKGPPVDQLWMLNGEYITHLIEHGLNKTWEMLSEEAALTAKNTSLSHQYFLSKNIQFHENGPAKWDWEKIKLMLLPWN